MIYLTITEPKGLSVCTPVAAIHSQNKNNISIQIPILDGVNINYKESTDNTIWKIELSGGNKPKYNGGNTGQYVIPTLPQTQPEGPGTSDLPNYFNFDDTSIIQTDFYRINTKSAFFINQAVPADRCNAEIKIGYLQLKSSNNNVSRTISPNDILERLAINVPATVLPSLKMRLTYRSDTFSNNTINKSQKHSDLFANPRNNFQKINLPNITQPGILINNKPFIDPKNSVIIKSDDSITINDFISNYPEENQTQEGLNNTRVIESLNRLFTTYIVEFSIDEIVWSIPRYINLYQVMGTTIEAASITTSECFSEE